MNGIRPSSNLLLPIVERSTKSAHNPARNSAATCLRVALVLLIGLGLRISAQHRFKAALANTSEPERTAAIARAIRAIPAIAPDAQLHAPDSNGNYPISDANGNSIGLALTSMPEAKSVVGYRGTSDCVVVLDAQWHILGVRLLHSQDTPEHVDAITRSDSFFAQFSGKPFNGLDAKGIDAVSGATLTSLAIAEGILVRSGQEKPSLRFPSQLTVDEIDTSLGHPSEQANARNGFSWRVDTQHGQVTVLRTGTLVEDVIGYQGPTELRLVFDGQDSLLSAALRSSFDNEPYVDYVRTDKYFWKSFVGKSLHELSQIDLEQAGIEGVSGATMTSTAVAETLVASAERYLHFRLAEKTQAVRSPHSLRLPSAADCGTLAVLLAAIVIGFTSWRSHRWVRLGWNIVLVGYFGLVTGNLISQTVLMGWASSGIAWTLAPGLASVVVVSFLFSATTKRNLYCSHICPHGAAQQLLRNRVQLPVQIPAAIKRSARWIPGAILCSCILATALGLDLNLSAVEPFNAYVWYLSGAASLALAMVSLGASAVIPMAYCKYGCPTGRLLEYVRHNARAHKFHFADGIALLLAAVIWWNALMAK